MIPLNFKYFIRLIIAVFVLTQLSAAGQSKTFTIDEAINNALRQNNNLKIASLNIEKADAAVGEAFGYALPSVDLSANFSHFLKKPKTSFPDFNALLTNASYSILFDEQVIPRDNSKFLPIGNALQSFVQANNYETQVQVTQTLFNSAVFRGIGASQIYLDLSKEDLKELSRKPFLMLIKPFTGFFLQKDY